MKVLPYSAADKPRWDSFVRNSRNGTLLFERSYMDYHAERFKDASLLIEDEGRLLALLPASRHGDSLRSHGGLTYGGFITDAQMRVEKMLSVFATTCNALRAAGIRQLEYKAIPHIYHRQPTEEDLYALFRHGAHLLKREPSAAIELAGLHLPSMKRYGARQALKLGLRCTQATDASELMALIDSNLRARHGVAAVHTAAEMQQLHANFPQHIELLEVRDATGVLHGGAVVYLAGPVAHTQYLASSDSGRRSSLMELLECELAERYRNRCRWLEFGISSENGGQTLNAGLMRHKEKFGARCVCYDTYLLDL
ncbi:GNAT family N-acetyltransferase [Uliginosibacterium sediminicola]|uniref:GNAT family N-acetyltransferase n=1 Tax=Uliginosibacterium sediminicola TaxID=2024550 RepID=A0ABU9YVD6_9RHOO